MWEAVKAVLREKFIAKNIYIKKQERYQINSLSLHLKKLEKEQIEPKVRKKKKRNNKDQIRNKWNREQKKKKKRSLVLVPWKDEQNWQILSLISWEKKPKEPKSTKL